jgi:hypothetical protein
MSSGHEAALKWSEDINRVRTTVDFLFNEFDLDHKNALDFTESSKLVKQLFENSKLPPPTATELTAEFKKMDTNVDEKISKAELTSFLQSRMAIVLNANGFQRYPDMNGTYRTTGKTYSNQPRYSNGSFDLYFATGGDRNDAKSADRWHLKKDGQILGYACTRDVTQGRWGYLCQ